MSLQTPAMNNDRSETFAAFLILRRTLTRLPPDVVRSFYGADEVWRTLNVIFNGQCENVNNIGSRPGTHQKRYTGLGNPPTLYTEAFPKHQSLPFSASVLNLIQALKNSSREITEALQDPRLVAFAPSRNSHTGKDPRAYDIRKGKSSRAKKEEKARMTLAQRGLAAEYRRWYKGQSGHDIIDELINNPKAKSRKCSISMFLEEQFRRFGSDNELPKGIQHGIKMLLLERLFGKPIISAILNFHFDLLWKIHRNELTGLCDAIRNIEWVTAIVDVFPDWLETYQAKYDGKSSIAAMLSS